MKKIYKSLIIFLAVALVTASFTGCGASGSDKVNVNTVAAQKQALDSGISVTGVLLPANTINVASKLAGSYQVTAINVEVGSMVKKGETIADLDTTQLDAMLEKDQGLLSDAQDTLSSAKSGKSVASSSYSSAKKNYEGAEDDYNEAVDMFNGLPPTATQEEKDKAQAYVNTTKAARNAAKAAYYQAKSGNATAQVQVDQLEASVNGYQAAVDIDELQIANASITSPTDGVVVSRNVNVGEMAGPSAPLFTIADVSTLKLKGTVSQEALPSISEGQSVDVSVDIYPGTAYKGTITLIAPIAVSTGEYFPVEISIPSESGLKPGLSASASIKVTGASNIIVPISAIKTENGVSSVFVLKDGAAVKREVKTGLSNTNSIEILSGLEEGESVITSNVSILSDGMQVNEQNGEHTAD
jgi:HlyD family secretion protein